MSGIQRVLTEFWTLVRLVILSRSEKHDAVLAHLIRRTPRWTAQPCRLLPPPRSAPTPPSLCSAWLPARRLTPWVNTQAHTNRRTHTHLRVYHEPNLLFPVPGDDELSSPSQDASGLEEVMEQLNNSFPHSQGTKQQAVPLQHKHRCDVMWCKNRIKHWLNPVTN